jgi:hypothetical protein
MNRLKSPQRFGKTIPEVCLKPYQFSCWNKKDPNYSVISSIKLHENHIFDLCWRISEKAYYKQWPDLTHGSDHYYASWLSSPPFWAGAHTPKICIGQHVFFKIYPEERK